MPPQTTTETEPFADLVIIIVLDGLRPDMISRGTTPNIVKWKEAACWFRNSSSIFPTMTRVAAASISSGAYPSKHGIINNVFFHPPLSPHTALNTSQFIEIRKAEQFFDNKLVTASSFGEKLAERNLTMSIAHCGSAGSAYMLNNKAKINGHQTFSIHGAANTVTPEAVTNVVDKCGSIPEFDTPRYNICRYITDVFLSTTLSPHPPDVACIWYPEPDTTFHYRGIGTEDSTAILRHIDREFGRIIDWINSQPNRERIGVMLLSDHGQITVTEQIDLTGILCKAGFPTSSQPDNQHLFSFTQGRTNEIRLRNHDHFMLNDLTTYLMEQPEVGMVFRHKRSPNEQLPEGTLEMSLIMADHERAPDLYVILYDDGTVNKNGLSGCGLFTGGVPVGFGMHGGLNRYELNNVLMLSGPEVALKGVCNAPSGLIDIAPTILHWLGIREDIFQGRILDEAFGNSVLTTIPDIFSASYGTFHQKLTTVTYKNCHYIIEGKRVNDHG